MNFAKGLAQFVTFFYGEDATPFSVRVKKNQMVGELKDLIKTKKSHGFKDVDARHLQLKWNLPNDNDSNPDRIDVLNPMEEIENIFFSGNDAPKEECIHVRLLCFVKLVLS